MTTRPPRILPTALRRPAALAPARAVDADRIASTDGGGADTRRASGATGDARVPVLRQARARLREAAALPEKGLAHALRAFLMTAHETGVGATTACAIACAAITEGLPPLSRQAAEEQAYEYYRHVREIVGSLEPWLEGAAPLAAQPR